MIAIFTQSLWRYSAKMQGCITHQSATINWWQAANS